jgi:prostaglandin-E synthase 1
MQDLASLPAFNIYALCTVVLCLNLLALWGYSGGVRGKSRRTPNPEDVTTVSKGHEVNSQDSPEMERVLRAHRNALVNILPFLPLALIYVIYGATPLMAWIFFGGFTVVRLGHSFAYLGGKQPWRTICFALGGLITFGLMIQVARIAVARMM